jgi:[ribosomal protein S5]-alanine N-acetyltransferase
MKLKTERLVLRDIELADAVSIRENVKNIKVSRFLALVPHPYTKKDATWWVNHCVEEQKKKPRENYEVGIVIKPGKEVVGAVSLTNINKFNGTATLGYWLGEDYWRKGYMSEAAKEIIRFGFEKLKLRRINVEAYVGNEASNGLIKKLGFNFEGTEIESHRIKATGKIVDAHRYGLLKKNWKK